MATATRPTDLSRSPRARGLGAPAGWRAVLARPEAAGREAQ
jgi:hypothetical protein